jgi:carboxymethylenebutenolidase
LTEQQILIKTPDGEADGFFYQDESGRRLPGVIFLTDIGGIRPTQQEMARRLAGEGYTVVLPNIFYRTGRPPLVEMPPDFRDRRMMKRMGELSAPLTPEAFERDTSAYIAFMRSQASVAAGPMGVVGFCYSSALAMRMAAAQPDEIAAMASFHGGRLATDDPSSPLLLLPRIKSELYFGHAVEDRSMPKEAIDKLNAALAHWGGRYESEVYKGAHHGWTVRDHPSYDQPQAERAFEKLRDLLARNLKQEAASASS